MRFVLGDYICEVEYFVILWLWRLCHTWYTFMKLIFRPMFCEFHLCMSSKSPCGNISLIWKTIVKYTFSKVQRVKPFFTKLIGTDRYRRYMYISGNVIGLFQVLMVIFTCDNYRSNISICGITIYTALIIIAKTLISSQKNCFGHFKKRFSHLVLSSSEICC